MTLSYRILFLGMGKDFQYTTEGPSFDEEDEDEYVEMAGTFGCVIGLSLAGPVAIVKFTAYEESLDGAIQDCPDIDSAVFTLAGEPMSGEDYVKETLGAEALPPLIALRAECVKVLSAAGILVIPEEQASKPVPWLTADDEVWVGEEFTGKVISVQDAFFFRGP